jgi:hypothetical protein
MKRQQKHSIGALFQNRSRRNPKAPKMTGKLTLDPATFEFLMNLYESGDPVELSLCAWNNIASDSGMPYLTIKAQIPAHLSASHDADLMAFLSDDDA